MAQKRTKKTYHQKKKYNSWNTYDDEECPDRKIKTKKKMVEIKPKNNDAGKMSKSQKIQRYGNKYSICPPPRMKKAKKNAKPVKKLKPYNDFFIIKEPLYGEIGEHDCNGCQLRIRIPAGVYRIDSASKHHFLILLPDNTKKAVNKHVFCRVFSE